MRLAERALREKNTPVSVLARSLGERHRDKRNFIAMKCRQRQFMLPSKDSTLFAGSSHCTI
jgi:hypothetical protein